MSTRPPRLPGNRVLRLSRPTPERIAVSGPRPLRRAPPPALALVLGFAMLIVIGTVLLQLPVASATGEMTPFLDALFTATSAVCVTGLVVVDTGTHWSAFGHVVILALIQIGGLGFMTSSTLLLLIFGRRISLRQRLVVREAMGSFSLSGLEGIVLRVVVVTLVIEAIGAVVLLISFARDFPLETALWHSLFHSVSGFNNAGFDLFGDFHSVAPYREDPLVLLVLGLLVLLGAMGVATLSDIARARSFHRMSLDTKLVLVSHLLLVLLGALAIVALEHSNPATLGALSPGHQVVNGLFLGIMPRSGGFSSVDIGLMTEDAQAIITVLMFIGGAPASTGGGIKLTTFSVLLAAIISTIRGREQAEAFGREIPLTIIFRALTVALLAVAFVMGTAILLVILEGAPFIVALFDGVSAFATVGLSTGLTRDLTPTSTLLLTIMMFVGRLGPLTLALALAQAQQPTTYHLAPEPVRIG